MRCFTLLHAFVGVRTNVESREIKAIRQHREQTPKTNKSCVYNVHALVSARPLYAFFLFQKSNYAVRLGLLVSRTRNVCNHHRFINIFFRTAFPESE